MAQDLHDRLTCRECGQWAEQCRDEQMAGRIQIHVSTCYPSAAIEDFRTEHGDDLPPGTVLSTSFLPEGEKPRDPLAFDAERAKAEFEEHQRRFGLSG